MELCVGMDDALAECLWVRISRQTNVDDMVGVCYRLPDQEDDVDEASSRCLKALCSQAVVLMGKFKHPYLCWMGTTAEHKQSRRTLSRVH